jgi:hypothetical protein
MSYPQGFQGGDPGTGAGPIRAGLPTRRLDQAYQPIGAPAPVGGAAGTLRARVIIVYGPNEGVFIYNGQPAVGNEPILSITNSTTDPFGNTVTPSLSLAGLPELIYSGPPALGNLIAAIAGQAGTDDFGNTYVAGAQFGAPGTEQIQLVPNANTPLAVSTLINGIFAGIAQLQTTDADESLAGVVGAAILGTGAAAKMSTLVSSPFGTQGACVLLAAQNDGGTDTAWAMICATSTPDDETLVITPLAWFAPYGVVIYSGASGTTVITKTSGSGTIPTAAAGGVVKAEAWAPGGGGGGAANFGASSAGGGEYACEPALAVGATVAYVIGAQGAGGAPGGNPSTSGGNVTITGTALTVTAHGGQKGTSTDTPGAGGTGSTNTVHFNGGAGAGTVGGQAAGAGGGGSGGPSSTGNQGGQGGRAPGTGGAAVPGGGAGGNGSANGQNRHTGAAPGGGGGGGGAGGTGGNGGGGHARVTYSSGAPPVLAAFTAAPMTDPFGTAVDGPGLFMAEQAAAPATPTGGGMLYVDGTGHLRYLGPGGTNTVLAGP